MRYPFTEHRIRARDRRLAAVHEAGHALVAMHLGLDVLDADIRPNPTDDIHSVKSYVGRATYDRPSNSEQSRLVSVAGMVAEEVWKARGPAYEHWWDAMSDPACMSGTDWGGTGCAPGAPDDALIEAAATVDDLLGGPLFPSLAALSRKIIEADSRRTPAAWMNVKRLLGYEVSSDSPRPWRSAA